jgi:hypothetical protein
MSRMCIEMSIDVPDPETFAAAAREWFARAPQVLAPHVWEEALRAEKAPFTGRPEPIWPDFDDFREPFMLWGEIIVAPLRWLGMKVLTRRLSRKNLEWLNEALAHRPVSAHVVVKRVDANGIKLPGVLSINAGAALGSRNELVPQGHLSADQIAGGAPGEAPYDFGLDCRQYAVLALERASAAGVRWMFANEGGGKGPTQLVDGLTYMFRFWELDPQPDLLGYSWITFCPPTAVAKLGGVAALADSGAFWRAEGTPDGGGLLQMTERAEDYGMAEAERAFEVLAPVLPAGVPARPRDWPEDVPWLVVPEDAATRRRRGSNCE